MSAHSIENEESEDFVERRMFPRTPVNCPALYRQPSNERWQVAKMLEYSATGISMLCDEDLPEGTIIDVQFKPGSIKTVPEFSVEGRVVRSELDSEQNFIVSVKVIKVLRDS